MKKIERERSALTRPGQRPAAGGSLMLLALVLALPLAGCALERASNKFNEPLAAPAPLLPVMPEANPVPLEPRADGSLWTPGLSGSFFADDKAFRKGDIVLVRVVQRSSGSKKANLDTSRESSISAKIKYLLGFEDEINNLTNYTNVVPATSSASGTSSGGKTTTTWDPNDLINAESSRSYKGEGTTERTDTLEATVSAVVTDVLSNGNLVIIGHQTVMLNSEASVLTVQGIIRPSDISAENTIDSARIANANIRFTGSGAVSDPQHPGWGMRVFDWVWPF